jgi:hypothetical protein
MQLRVLAGDDVSALDEEVVQSIDVVALGAVALCDPVHVGVEALDYRAGEFAVEEGGDGGVVGGEDGVLGEDKV